MDTPKTLDDIESLIKNAVQENLHLDYKESKALDANNGHKISKTVSSFANSDGGIIIYGVVEADNLPERIDAGVDHKKFTREWLEQVISTNITPRIDGLRIFPIILSDENSIYVVEIPKSFRAPHQAKDKFYYKRFNFESKPMEDYEINDVRNRQNVVLPLINIDFEAKSSHMLYITVSNVGTLPALNVSFEFPPDVLWISNRGTPTLFTQGIEYFPPKKTYRFLWNFSHALFASQDERVRKIDASATYLHPQVDTYVTDEFHIDLEGYRSNSTLKSDIEELNDTVKEQLNNIVVEIKKLNHHLEGISTISGATGLDLSITTLRNARRIFSSHEEFEKLPAKWCSCAAFREVLSVSYELASEIETHFSHGIPEKLEDVKGISPEIIEEIHNNFYLEH